jgi:3',5'-cyclic AMP phosphodiesterase CpdA
MPRATGATAPPARRDRLPAAWALPGIVLLVAASTAGFYRRQIVSHLTHRKGGPPATAPFEPYAAPPDVHLLVVGDIGDSGRRLEELAAVVAGLDRRTNADALLLLGDNVYPSGDPDRLPDTVFGPFGPVLAAGTDLLAILGNHDVAKGHGEAQMAALGMEGRWWSRRYGDVLLVGLDSNDPDNPEQLAWLEETLGSTDATWRIVALHHPPYSAGYQGSSTGTRRVFSPVFARHGVQLVLSGHDHDYQRSAPIDGVTYVVSGAGSGRRGTGEDPFTAVSWSFRHAVDIGITGDTLLLRAVGTDGRVADLVELRSG